MDERCRKFLPSKQADSLAELVRRSLASRAMNPTGNTVTGKKRDCAGRRIQESQLNTSRLLLLTLPQMLSQTDPQLRHKRQQDRTPLEQPGNYDFHPNIPRSQAPMSAGMFTSTQSQGRFFSPRTAFNLVSRLCAGDATQRARGFPCLTSSPFKSLR